MADYDIFELGNVVLQSGLTLRNAQLAYKTYGTLNSRRDNAIVYPTFYGAQHMQNEPMIGPGMALDPTAVLHYHSQHVRQRVVLIAEQYPTAVRPGPLPARDAV